MQEVVILACPESRIKEMSLKLYNTLTRKKEEFKPIHDKEVGIYTCGPTVYDLSHIGHARTYINFDILVRYLRYLGYKVNYVVNVTDVDDKIIARAKERGIDAKKFTNEMTDDFFRDFERLGIEKPTKMPKVTENIPAIIQFVEKLIERGYAYEAGGDVYFSVRKFKDYGKLSGNNIEQLESGARVEPGEKKQDPLDFALWKKAKDGETIRFNSPWGEGRPGWHIECSALSEEYVGETLDIHGGGNDLVFPHHEDEIAQSEAAHDGKKFARLWVHTGMVTVDGKKMSKSLGNFTTIRDVLEKYEPAVLRLAVLKTHYRKPIDFNESMLDEAKRNLDIIHNAFFALKERADGAVVDDNIRSVLKGEIQKEIDQFFEAMNDDLNTSLAITSFLIAMHFFIPSQVFYGICQQDAKQYLDQVSKIDEILGLNIKSAKPRDTNIPNKIKLLVQQREGARTEKAWKMADQIREQIEKEGYTVEDTGKGPVIKRK